MKYRKSFAFILIFTSLILITFISKFIPGQIDLTEEKIYTLSDGSLSLISKIKEPIELQFYFSQDVEELPIIFKNYAQRVEDILKQYERSSDGNIQLKLINPKPDTDMEESAIRYGLASHPLPSGLNLFFGLVAIQGDQERVLPAFSMDREAFIEYDISRLLYEVQQVEKPKIGVISSLPVVSTPPMNPYMQQAPQSQSWPFVQELEKTHEIVSIENDIPDDITSLIILHPQNLSKALLYQIDQFVLSGKPTIIAVDPSSVFQKENMPQQAMMMGMAPNMSSDLPALFEAWGVSYDPTQVVGDLTYAATVSDYDGQSISLPIWIMMDQFSEDHIATANLNTLLFPESGFFSYEGEASAEWIPILESSPQSGLIAANQMAFADSSSIYQSIKPDGQAKTLGAILKGNLKTAFPDGKPIKEGETASEENPKDKPTATVEKDPKQLTESAVPSMVTLLADSDFLSERFSVQIVNFLGMQGMNPINDNIAFISNTLDLISGSSDLIGLRSKGTAQRPFKKVEALQHQAEAIYQEKLVALDSELASLQANLQQLQAQQSNQKVLVATPELNESIENYRLEEAKLRKEKRAIRKKLRESIEGLKLSLSLINLLLIPFGIGISGLVFFYQRNHK